MTKVLSLRVEDELAEWADAYAASRGVTRQALLETGLRSFKEDCEKGVPELREQARRQSTVKLEELQGVGDCPERPGELGHIWTSPRDDSTRRCEFCGVLGRARRHESGPHVGEIIEPGYFDLATADRTALFARLKAPDSAHGRVKK